MARSRARDAKAGCAEAAAETSYNGLAPKERGLSPTQWPCIVHKSTTTSAARRVRTATLHAAPPPLRQRAQWALTRARRESRLCGRPQPAHRTTVLHRGREASCRRSDLYSVRIDHIQRGAGRTRCKFSCYASSQEAASAVGRSHTRHAKCRLQEAKAGTSHHGFAPRERVLWSTQLSCIESGLTTSSAARSTRAASTRPAPPPQRQRAYWCAHARAT